MIYKNDYLNEISFPLGGIGSGCIGISGNGALIDWEIFNRPNKGGRNTPSFFLIKAVYPDGKVIVKVLQGDCNKDLMGQTTKKFDGVGYGYGVDASKMFSYPHFKNVVFDGNFPIAKLTFSDDNFPGIVKLTAFSPLIPLDSENSSLPCAFFDITIDGRDDVDYYVIFTLNNPFVPGKNYDFSNENYSIMHLVSNEEKDSTKYGDISIGVSKKHKYIQKYWRRGLSRDSYRIFWDNITNGDLVDRDYDDFGYGNACSIECELKNKETIKCVISWNIPNAYNYWDSYKDENGNDISWKNYYATKFDSSFESCVYALDNYDILFKKTNGFVCMMYESSLDESVKDAILSNLSVLKSPTVMRLENGEFYGFEGTHETFGSCEGTCTHVWSYAYALCFLFPDLERSIRDVEFKYDTSENGRMKFRTKLPLGRTIPNRPQCLDGQMLSVVKSYREWLLSGDDGWLIGNWNTIKKVLEYAWSKENYQYWDRDKDGVLEGVQHNTLDADLFGPSSWLEGLYLLALKSTSVMADYLGDIKAKKKYMSLYRKGYKYTKDNLFSGEYFIQNIDVKDKALLEKYDSLNYWDDEIGEIKYQIQDGCEIDQMLAQWHSNILDLGDIFDKKQRKIALNSMMKYNYKESLREFPNLWRVYALNDERGAIMCAYPNGVRKPKLPIQYSDECMTGFEYAFAGLLMSEGKYKDGIKVVKSIRDRYDGKKRNPYNEIECGGNYARSMASFALLPIISGFKFDLPHKTLGFSPILKNENQNYPWFVGSAYGIYKKNNEKEEISIIDGKLKLSKLVINKKSVKSLNIDGKDVSFKQKGKEISFDEIEVCDKIIVR